jgi:serine/threonine protein kinase
VVSGSIGLRTACGEGTLLPHQPQGDHEAHHERTTALTQAQHEEFVLPSTLSQKARSFIGSLILWEPEERMGAKEALNHPFIRDYAPVEF